MNPNWMASTYRAMDMIVRTSTEPGSFVPAIKRVVQNIDPEQPLANVNTMRTRMDELLSTRRFTLSLLGIFSLIAFLLGGIGLYGVMAYHVSQRTREIEIRMALGAQRANVSRLVVKQGMGLVVLAVALGLVAAFGLTRL